LASSNATFNNVFPEPVGAAAAAQPAAPPAPAVPAPAVAPGEPTTQAPPPTEPRAEAQAALATSAGTPEQVLAAQGTPEQALARETSAFGQLGVTGAPAAAPAIPVVPQLSPRQEIIARGVEPEAPRGEQAARIVGPAATPGQVTPPQILSQADAKTIVNRAAEQSGLEGRILYAPDESALPRRIRMDLAATGNSGQTQTIWDNRDGQLWVIGNAFRNASDLHRALIEEAIPRIFDHGQMPITTVHDDADPRLGWRTRYHSARP
jgi:hypothetical protein